MSFLVAAWQAHLHALSFFLALYPRLRDGADLLEFRPQFQHYGTVQFFGDYHQSFNYGAPLAPLARLLLAAPHPATLYRGLLALFLLALGAVYVRARGGTGGALLPSAVFATAVLCLASPSLMLRFTCNLELFVCLCTAAGMLAFATGRQRTAAVCFGLAGSFKYFPLLLLALFLRRGKLGLVGLGLLCFAGSTLAGLLLLGPTVPDAALGLLGELAKFRNTYLLHWELTGNGYDHSPFGIVKLVLTASGHEAGLPSALRAYLGTVAVGVSVLFFRRIQHLPDMERALALTVLCVWVTPMSQEYTLAHLFFPFGWLLIEQVREDRFPAEGMRSGPKHNDRGLLLCFGVVLANITFLSIGPARLGGNLKAIALGVLLVLVLRRAGRMGRGGTPRQASFPPVRKHPSCS